MHPSNTDLPSILKLPEDTTDVIDLIKHKLDEGADVLIIDRRQQSLVIYSGELKDEEVTSESLPFLLSNHSVKVLPSNATLTGCLEDLLAIDGTICVFHNPSEEVPCALPTHPTKIINPKALLGLVQQEEKRFLTSITVGQI